MGINRFYRRQLRNQYVPMSFEELSLVPSTKAKAHGQMMQQAEMMRQDVNELPWDREVASEIENANSKRIDDFTKEISQYGVDHISSSDIGRLSRDFRGDAKKLSGLQGRTSSYQSMMAEYDAIAKKNPEKAAWVQMQKDWLTQANSKMPATFDNEGNVSGIFSRDYVDEYTPAELLKELKEIELDLRGTGSNVNVAGTVFKDVLLKLTSGTLEYRDQSKIMSYLNRVGQSPKMLGYMTRLKEMNPNLVTGIASLDGENAESYIKVKKKGDKEIAEFNPETALGRMFLDAQNEASVRRYKPTVSWKNIGMDTGDGGNSYSPKNRPITAGQSNEHEIDAHWTSKLAVNNNATKQLKEENQIISGERNSILKDASGYITQNHPTLGFNGTNTIVDVYKKAEARSVANQSSMVDELTKAYQEYNIPAEQATQMALDTRLHDYASNLSSLNTELQNNRNRIDGVNNMQETYFKSIKAKDKTFSNRYKQYDKKSRATAQKMVAFLEADTGQQFTDEQREQMVDDLHNGAMNTLYQSFAAINKKEGAFGFTREEVREVMESDGDLKSSNLYTTNTWKKFMEQYKGASGLAIEATTYPMRWPWDNYSRQNRLVQAGFDMGNSDNSHNYMTRWQQFDLELRHDISNFMDDTPTEALKAIGMQQIEGPISVNPEFNSKNDIGESLEDQRNLILNNLESDLETMKAATGVPVAEQLMIEFAADDKYSDIKGVLGYSDPKLGYSAYWNPSTMEMELGAMVTGSVNVVNGDNEQVTIPTPTSVSLDLSSVGEHNISKIFETISRSSKLQEELGFSTDAIARSHMVYGHSVLKNSLGTSDAGIAAIFRQMEDKFTAPVNFNYNGIDITMQRVDDEVNPYRISVAGGTPIPTVSTANALQTIGSHVGDLMNKIQSGTMAGDDYMNYISIY